MGKAVLFSLLLVTIALPALIARGRSPVRAFRRLVLAVAAFNTVYLFTVLYLLPRLG